MSKASLQRQQLTPELCESVRMFDALPKPTQRRVLRFMELMTVASRDPDGELSKRLLAAQTREAQLALFNELVPEVVQ